MLLVKPSQLLSALDIWLAVLKHTHAQKRRTLEGHSWQHLDDSVLTKHKKKQQHKTETFLAVIDGEVDEEAQQEQEEEAAGDSSRDAGDGGATQPVTCSSVRQEGRQ